MIEARLQETCAHLIQEELQAPAPAELTQFFLEQQQEVPVEPGKHHFAETTGYLKCTHCGMAILKRANDQIYQAFIDGARVR